MTAPSPSYSGSDDGNARRPATPVGFPAAPPPVPGALAPPPVPSPLTVPPPVPPTIAAGDANDVMAPALVIERRGGRSRRRGGAAAVLFSMLAVAAAAAAAYVAWPHLQRAVTAARKPVRKGPRIVAVAEQQPSGSGAEAHPAVEAAPRREPAPAPMPAPEPMPATEIAPEVAITPPPTPTAAPTPTPEPAPMPEPAFEQAPEPPPIDVEQVRKQVGDAITRAFAAYSEQDFAAATRELNAVADVALDDQQATDRLHRWRQFDVYAREYPRYRDEALGSAAATAATYDLGKRQIGVVELNAKEFIYRDSRQPGRNLRVPKNRIPPDVETALVGAWFDRDGRAANQLFLGAGAVARRTPDLRAARRAWEAAAAAGEPHGTLLLQLLDDPAVRGR